VNQEEDIIWRVKKIFDEQLLWYVCLILFVLNLGNTWHLQSQYVSTHESIFSRFEGVNTK